MNGLMKGKRGLVMGVANDHSIAWGIAQKLAEQGADLAFTYQGEAFGRRVKPLAEQLGAKLVVPCDVEDSASVAATFDELEKAWGGLDFVVHAIGFSDKNELRALTPTPRATTSSARWSSPAIPSPKSPATPPASWAKAAR